MMPPAENTKNPNNQPIKRMIAIKYNMVISFNNSGILFQAPRYDITQFCASVPKELAAGISSSASCFSGELLPHLMGWGVDR